MKIFHFTRGFDGQVVTIEPQDKPNRYSRREFQTWGEPRSFWYTDPADRESMIGGNLYIADVDEDKLLNFSDIALGDFRGKHGVDFDALKHHATSQGKIGFRYTVAGRDIVVLFEPLKSRKVKMWNT